MPEKTITLEGVEPLAFYGVANANLNRICDLFPKLKIVARGSSIKAIGDEAELERFQEKMQALMPTLPNTATYHPKSSARSSRKVSTKRKRHKAKTPSSTATAALSSRPAR